MNNQFLGMAEASNYLGVCRNTLYSLCSRGVLSYYQGKGKTSKIRFRADDLERYLNTQKRETKASETV